MISRKKNSTAPPDLQVCETFHVAIELIGKRWSGAVISVLMKGANRFKDLRDSIPGVSDRLLIERLKDLEEAGIISRTVLPSRPPQVTYNLTDKGRALTPVLEAISTWGHAWNK